MRPVREEMREVGAYVLRDQALGKIGDLMEQEVHRSRTCCGSNIRVLPRGGYRPFRITNRSTHSGWSMASLNATRAPISWPTITARRWPRARIKSRMSSVHVRLSESANPRKSGAMSEKRRLISGKSLRQQNELSGQPWRNTTGGPDPASTAWRRIPLAFMRRCSIGQPHSRSARFLSVIGDHQFRRGGFRDQRGSVECRCVALRHRPFVHCHRS